MIWEGSSRVEFLEEFCRGAVLRYFLVRGLLVVAFVRCSWEGILR